MFKNAFVRFIVAALIALMTVCIAPLGFAQSGKAYPSRSIKIITPFAVGGSSDILARTLAQVLSARTGATVVVENKPGASGAIAMDAVARSAPDGYTLFWASDSSILAPLVIKDFPVDPLKDLAPLAKVGTAPVVISVKKDLPARSIKELVELAKAKPGALSYGSGGLGTTHNLAAEEFKLRANIDMLHVPYKGVAPALSDAMGGNIDVVLTGVVEVSKYMTPDSMIRVLAVMGKDRVADLPGVPTMIESGYPDFTSGSWFGVMGPLGLPQPIANWLSDNVVAAAQSVEFRQRAHVFSLEISPTNGPDTAAFIKSLSARYKQVIAKSGLTVQ